MAHGITAGVHCSGMRLGILGPAAGDLGALARAAQLLLDDVQAEKIIYLGDDDALDRMVAEWARDLVGSDPGDEGLFARAAARCASAEPQAIDAFVASESARLRLRVFAALPKGSRTIEILDGRVVLFVYDKATLDEEDIVAASILVFGKGDSPVVHRVGTRVFVAPGPVSDKGGAVVLDDGAGGVRIEVMSGTTGAVVATEHFGQQRESKIRVQGG
jgi:hypothetical protein